MKDKNNKKLEKYMEAWQCLIDILPYPVSIHDPEFNIVYANKMFSDLHGKADVQGMKCYQLIHCKEVPVEDCPIEKTLKTKQAERSEIYEPTLQKHLLIQTAPIKHEDKLIGIVHSMQDITDMKNLEASLRETTEILGSSLEEVKKREFSLEQGKEAFLNMLEDITESHKELEELFVGLLRALVNALDAKSPWTKGHSERVANYADETARKMGLDEDEIKDLHLAALLHDIGKIGTYDYLLDKPAKLTKEEFEKVKKHPAQGAEILKGIKQLRNIIPLIRQHHERIDGKGYPDGLKGNEILLGARILHVVDSFDSMTADRPYRPSPGIEYAVLELKKHSGTQFDPQVTEAFLRVLEKRPDLSVSV